MLRPTLKLIHYLALSAFVGSIFVHILLGRFAGSGLANDAFLFGIQVMVTKILICGGIGLLLVSGTGMLFLAGGISALGQWLKIKLALVAFVIANTAIILIPTGQERSRQATDALGGGQLLANFADLGLRESVFGAINLASVVGIIILSIRRRPV